MRVSVGTLSVTSEQTKSGLKAKFFTAAMAATLLMGGAAHAEAYKFGDVSVSMDTTLSAGISMRTSDRDCAKVNVSMAAAKASAVVVRASTRTTAT